MNKESMLEQLNTKRDEIVDLLSLRGYPKLAITVRIDQVKSARVAGYARVYYNEVVLNETYLRDHFDEMLTQVLGHEICHIYQHHYMPRAKQAHGPEWKYLMRLIGLAPNTYHSMSTPELISSRRTKKRYIYVNTVSGKIYHVTPFKHKKYQGEVRLANGQLVVWKGKIEEYI